MKYSITIKKRFKKEYEDIYKRKDESFAEGTIRSLIDDIEKNNEKTKEEKQIISDFLYEEWCHYFELHKAKIEERKKQGLFW